MGLFKTVLILIDFTTNTEVAICKALEIANAEDVTIHLLHVCKPFFNNVNLERTGVNGMIGLSYL